MRYLLTTLDYRTGTHTLHNWPTASEEDCAAINARLPPTDAYQARILFHVHDDDGKPKLRSV